MIRRLDDDVSFFTAGEKSHDGIYISDDGRIRGIQFYIYLHVNVRDHMADLLDRFDLTLDDVEFFHSYQDDTSYTPDQYRRFANYIGFEGVSHVEAIGDGFAVFMVRGMGYRDIEIAFDDRDRFGDYEPYCYVDLEPTERSEKTYGWGFGPEFSERNHLWPKSDGIRDYSADEITDTVRTAMENMRDDGMIVPDSLSLLQIPSCREPVFVTSRIDDPAFGYIQAAFETRVHMLDPRMTEFIRAMNSMEVFSKDDF